MNGDHPPNGAVDCSIQIVLPARYFVKSPEEILGEFSRRLPTIHIDCGEHDPKEVAEKLQELVQEFAEKYAPKK